MADKFTLFDGDECNQKLSPATIVEEQSFGQFLELRDENFRSITLDDKQISASSNYESHKSLNRIDRHTVSINELLSGKIKPLFKKLTEVKEFVIENLDETLASRIIHLPVDNKTDKGIVELTLENVNSLLKGSSIKVTDQQGVSWIVVPKVEFTASKIPAVTSYNVSSLADFIYDPKIPGSDGNSFPIKLQAKQVAALRRGDSFEMLTVNNIKVKISHNNGFVLLKKPKEEGGEPTLPRENDVNDDPGASGSSGSTGSTTGGINRGGSNSTGSTASGTGNSSTNSNGGQNTTTNPQPVVEVSEPPLLGIYLPWKQSWELQGYARGKLLQSLSLAPQEEVTIELFTWDRIHKSLEQSSETDTDQSYEQSLISKDVTDVVKELSKNTELQVQADVRATVTYPPVTVSVGGGIKFDEKAADLSKKTTNQLHEATTKATARVSTKRTSKVSESREIGREDRVTRRLKNQNLCHTVTYDYFEIVAGYKISTEFLLDKVIPVALLPNPQRNLMFDKDSIRLHERALRMALVDSNLVDGFAAARFLESRQNAMDIVCEKPACACTTPAPPNTSQSTGGIVDFKPLKAALLDIQKAWSALKRGSYKEVLESLDEYGHNLDANGNEYGQTPSESKIVSFRRWLCYQMIYAKRSSILSAFEAFVAQSSGIESETFDNNKLVVLAQNLKTGLPKEGLDNALNSLSDMSEDLKKIGESHIPDYAWFFAEINWLKDRLDAVGCYNLDDCGLGLACNQLDLAFNNVSGQLQQGIDGGKVDQAQQASKADAIIDQLTYAYPLKDIADAKERYGVLETHLNNNATYYRYAVFTSLPVSEQLHQLSITATPGWLEPRVVGMVGDKLALPVNVKAIPGLEDLFKKQITENPYFKEPGFSYSETVTLPTPGITMQSRLGDCSACEPFIEESRKIDLTTRRAQAHSAQLNVKLQQAELDRYLARIKNGNLDDPDLNAGPRPGEWSALDKE